MSKKKEIKKKENKNLESLSQGHGKHESDTPQRLIRSGEMMEIGDMERLTPQNIKKS